MRRWSIVAVLVLLLGLVVSAHTGREVTEKCPVCGTKFSTMATMSASIMGRTHDLENTGAVGTMYEDSVASCPTCHYSWYQADFAKPLDPSLKTWVVSTLKPRYKGAVDKVEAFRIAAEIAERLKKPQLSIARIYLMASYVMRHQGGADEARKKLQQQAADHFEQGLAANEADGENVAVIQYVIGEMYRRQGKFDTALTWYYKALSDPMRPKEAFDGFVEDMQALAKKQDANNNI